MKFLIIGASGMVGNAFMNELGELDIPHIGTYHTRSKKGLVPLDVTDQQAVLSLLNEVKPGIVIQTAAQPNVDYCENHREEAWRTNVLGTESVANACRTLNAKHVFISTDYVFDGTAGPYGEDDPVNPINYYATTKVEGERRVKALQNHLIVRTGVVFDAEPDSKNFALRVVKELSSGKSLRVPMDQIGNPTLASNLAACSIELSQKNRKGIYNVAGRTIMSRSDFAYLVCRKFDLNDELIQPVASEELQQKAKRPKKLGLRTDKASKELATELLTADAAVDRFREKLKQI
jgi:dTDP-4-dehydrorhamnose reductase